MLDVGDSSQPEIVLMDELNKNALLFVDNIFSARLRKY
jgi:hypothetical protein